MTRSSNATAASAVAAPATGTPATYPPATRTPAPRTPAPRTSSAAVANGRGAGGPDASAAIGSVAFVGAGPGDPGLLTLRAVELLAVADVVLLDGAVSAAVATHCRPDVAVVEGTSPDGAPLSEKARAKLAVDAARAGRHVVRLVDGDPALYPGTGEEAGACARAGIPFEVVPGVSPASAVPTYAGIPLTSKRVREVRVVDAAADVDWSAYATSGTSLVLLNAAGRIDCVAAALVAAGLAAT
ncbi:MAG: SAM-dependent methyltransferase, partial [Actinomycetota bacterium]|nr:SAM-dependent methyltransferase [Actinomycetota bacterium]